MPLPVNIDTTYDDNAGDPSVQIHQSHHDSLHSYYNELESFGGPAEFANDFSTGIFWGGLITVNGGNTGQVDIAAAAGQTIDNTDPANVVYNRFDYAGATGVTPPEGVSYYYIDGAGALQNALTAPTEAQRRTRAYLARVFVSGGVVAGIAQEQSPVQQPIATVKELAIALGDLKTSGLQVQPNGANLNIDFNGGTLYSIGANLANDPLNPNFLTFTGVTATEFSLATVNGIQSTGNTVVPVGDYDNAGTITAIGGTANESSIFTVYMFESGNISLAYGQDTYPNLEAAVNAIATRNFTTPADFGPAVRLGYIVAKKDATDLSDTTQAKFFATNKFGGLGGGTTVQAGAYTPGGNDVVIADGGTGASDAATARANLGVAIGTDVQAYDADLDTIAAANNGTVLANTTASFTTTDETKLDGLNIGSTVQAYDADLDTIAAANNGTVLANTTASFTTADETKLDGIESGAAADQNAAEVPITDAGALYTATDVEAALAEVKPIADAAYTPGGTDVAIADGGTGASDATTARSNLGLTIGTDVQAHSTVLDNTTASYTTAEETKLAGIETGATADQNAAEVSIADSGAVYTATDVEGALQEVKTQSDQNTTDIANIQGSPTGSMTMYAGTTPPTDWLLCDGSAVSRSTYSNLFSLIGTSFGAGDGSTTFNLPDMRGRVPLGLDNLGGTAANRVTATNADNLGGSGGTENHTLNVAEMPTHAHSVSGNATGGSHGHSGATANDNHAHTTNNTSGNHTHTGSTTQSGSHEHSYNRPNNGTAAAGNIQVIQNRTPGVLTGSAGSHGHGMANMNSAGNHSHNLNFDEHAHNFNTSNTSHNHGFSTTSGNSGSGSSHTNMQPYLSMGYIIKT